MKTIKTLYVTGYKSFELGVFKENDPKIKIIKKVLTQALRYYLEQGLEWVLIAGNLGTEIWAAEVVLELKKEYEQLHLGILYPYQAFGQNWNETNQTLLQKIVAQADYVEAVSHQPYQQPQQLRAHQQFLLTHTQGSLLVYDPDYPGKTSYYYEAAQQHAEQIAYEIHLITMDELQNAAFELESD